MEELEQYFDSSSIYKRFFLVTLIGYFCGMNLNNNSLIHVLAGMKAFRYIRLQ